MNSLKWTILVPLGLVAGVVLTFPMLVVIGLYCLIIPGLILSDPKFRRFLFTFWQPFSFATNFLCGPSCLRTWSPSRSRSH
jgi:hypothetical protein